ncbi:biotin--[acetyl-CoA-carboxylase] ligase [Solicola gregarius]|uniref:biotin--[biotin carboxyl-carrier protein] ligase n=1 Tax=Solicola gregarius TaxID=2908642 RepID=A0AA46TF55_9ACTN|nr:biotin--[acetyl-CoA-carboxylase] ligase [Solicola gregarius]UYM04010.1 biotin--[acetyl-CoA-carboxylase] ligase [Solicola gregarius]
MSRYDDLERPPLNQAVLASALVGPGTWWRSVTVLQDTTSTNADLADRARDDAPEGSALVADHQRGGRGRLDRGWEFPPRSGLALSMLVRPDAVPAARWPWLPLLTGIAVHEAVTDATDVETSLKWPNDVLVGERKLAGILVERVETPTGPAAVVGVGLNVSLAEDELPVPTATSLAIEGARTTDRSVLVRSLMRTFEPLYRAWAAAEGDPTAGMLDSYVRRCSTVGRSVDVHLPDGSTLSGVAEAVDSDGRLVVGVGGTRRALSAGDVVHVRPQP